MSQPPDKTPPSSHQADAVEGADRSSHLGYVAHEMRNPLSTAIWTAELLTRLSAEERAGARGEKLAAICHRSVGRVRLLVEDHLLCERLDAGGYPVRPESLLVAEALAAAQVRLGAGVPPATLDVSGTLKAVADRALLERALEGLLAAAGEGDAAVRVVVTQRGAFVEVRVTGASPGPLADPGRGAPSEQRGRSLALPMARRVATALGGVLQVDQEAYLLSIPAA